MLNGPAPGPVIVVGSAVLLSSSSPRDSVIVVGALPRLKSIVLGLVATSACWTAHRSVPKPPSSAVLVMWNVESRQRSSSASTDGLIRCRATLRRQPPNALADSDLASPQNRRFPFVR